MSDIKRELVEALIEAWNDPKKNGTQVMVDALKNLEAALRPSKKAVAKYLRDIIEVGYDVGTGDDKWLSHAIDYLTEES